MNHFLDVGTGYKQGTDKAMCSYVAKLCLAYKSIVCATSPQSITEYKFSSHCRVCILQILCIIVCKVCIFIRNEYTIVFGKQQLRLQLSEQPSLVIVFQCALQGATFFLISGMNIGSN